MDGGFKRAWDTLVAIRSPFGQASGFGIALSALGYVVVPTVIGVAAGAAITVFTNERLTTVEEAVADIQRMVEEEPQEQEEGAKQAEPPSQPKPKGRPTPGGRPEK